MDFAIRNIIVALIFFLVIIIGIIALQIFLSKRDSKWLGIIMPMISFIISLMVVVGLSTFNNMKTDTTYNIDNGKVSSQIVENLSDEQSKSNSSVVGLVFITFIMYNIPTAVLLAIYASCRGKRKRTLDIEKMKIQDL